MESEQEIKFYNVAEVSEILGISRSKEYEWGINRRSSIRKNVDASVKVA